MIAAAVALLTGGSVAAAGPAHAINGQVRLFMATSTELFARSGISNFPLGPFIPFPVSISRVVDGSAQVVASGVGTATYRCNGTAINTYTALDQELTVPCG
ncbi:hypothetical protein CF165_36920 [Amycolatopsis vastitatis]|uniref:Uncharacterized protein n=1 Tax=Amycolatopsis vastitatis TaxID=1905142 RepID=A0A229SSS2_9PSEU|nr:hypothetical protein CF165_36920 [Amycolatopsis vastitatis]